MAATPSSMLVSHRQECASCGRKIETAYAASDYEPYVEMIEMEATYLEQLFGWDTTIYCDSCYADGRIDFKGKNLVYHGDPL